MRNNKNIIAPKEHHIHEECGVFGVFSETNADVASLAYYGLYALQHRGQESAGIAVNDDGVFSFFRDEGLVHEVFSPQRLQALGRGNIVVGHIRYATTGSDRKRNAQPIVINHHKGRMALAHNGNLTNSYELRTQLERTGSIFHTTTDSEVIAYLIVQERLRSPSIEAAVHAAMGRIEGAYSLVIASPSKLIAARDPYGFRPLCMGKTGDGKIVFASESCALDAVGAVFLRDIAPGEIVTVSYDGIRSDTWHCGSRPKRLCVFELIYFSRPDSVVDGTPVTEARQRAGAFLAEEHPVDADVVIGVPDSGLDAALGYARASGIPYGIGFTKNKYIGRTFISPTQEQREVGVNIKLNPIRSVVEGRRVVLIDDSIVRGTTCRGIIDLLRQAGAREIHMRVSAPPFVAPCYYGTDIDSAENLIANHHSVAEIAELIGVDSLGYLSMEHLIQIAGTDGAFCTACFGGAYPTAVPSHRNKDRFEQKLTHRKTSGEGSTCQTARS
ncbi:MAG: amidophosphoribosyltransferase [Oscillospiraceae bacterium]|nr:amidophosphoribosyltransferase [Oscillospiraceae bacterium]